MIFQLFVQYFHHFFLKKILKLIFLAFYNYIDNSEKNLYNNTLMVKTNKFKKATLTLDCRNVFIDKYSRELSITFEIKNNIISIKPASRKKEVGRFEQISLDDYLFENVTIDIESGEAIALVGKSGSGKTTIVDLILNIYLPSKGTVVLKDG
jgi:ABC-type glutathione transport system ATPase component